MNIAPDQATQSRRLFCVYTAHRVKEARSVRTILYTGVLGGPGHTPVKMFKLKLDEMHFYAFWKEY